MTPDDRLARLIELITAEVLARGRRGGAAVRVPRRAARLLSEPRPRRARRRRDAPRPPRRRRPARRGRRADRSHAAQAGRHPRPKSSRCAAKPPSSSSRPSASTRSGSRWRARLLRGTPVGVCAVVGFPARRHDADVKDYETRRVDLRRRARDRHGDQRRRAQVRRPAHRSSATSRRSPRPAARPAPSAR